MSSSTVNTDSNLAELQKNAKEYQKKFKSPMSLEAKRKLAILTCMDSRLMMNDIFGMQLGDAELIRNAGGRVTMDVLRSLAVACDIKELACTDIFVVHHTDCGGMAAVRQHDHLIKVLSERLGFLAGTVLKILASVGLDELWLQPIKDLDKSVQDDVQKLSKTSLIPDTIGIYGFVYSTEDGSLREICRREPKDRPAMPAAN